MAEGCGGPLVGVGELGRSERPVRALVFGDGGQAGSEGEFLAGGGTSQQCLKRLFGAAPGCASGQPGLARTRPRQNYQPLALSRQDVSVEVLLASHARCGYPQLAFNGGRSECRPMQLSILGPPILV